MMDWLDDEVPLEWLYDLIDLIRRTPNLDWLLLTKRPERFNLRLSVLHDTMGCMLTLDESYTKAFISNMLHGWHCLDYHAPELGRENYWMGTTVEDQQRADERIPHLLSIPARVRFLSCEPLLGPVQIDWPLDHPQRTAISQIDWVICGGESGSGARPMDLAWARSLYDQCRSAGVSFFMKQIDGKRKELADFPEDLRTREMP